MANYRRVKPHVCIDRRLPEDRLKAPQLIRPSSRNLIARLIAPLRKQWVNGSVLRVRFLDGTPTLHAVAKREAAWWENVANIRFDWVKDGESDIRIAFDNLDGAWSYIGTDCASIPQDQPTMNLGFLDRGTAAHEFGHALGLAHEHQNPEGGIVWNEAKVIRDLSGAPNFWDEDTIRHNVLEKYRLDQIKGTQFDPASIMLYWFPADWTLGGSGTDQNEELSTLDKKFIGSAAMYPHKASKAKKLVVDAKRRTEASIRKPGEEDLFFFTVPMTQAGRYMIDTRGNTNVAMRLFGPDSQTSLIAEDDDSGVNDNARIVADLIPGEYTVQVRHADQSKGTGKYSVRVWRGK